MVDGQGGQYFSLSALRKQILELQSIETTTFCIFVYSLSQNKVTTWTELVYWVLSGAYCVKGNWRNVRLIFGLNANLFGSTPGSSLTWPLQLA
jgi:hypothetical protein